MGSLFIVRHPYKKRTLKRTLILRTTHIQDTLAHATGIPPGKKAERELHVRSLNTSKKVFGLAVCGAGSNASRGSKFAKCYCCHDSGPLYILISTKPGSGLFSAASTDTERTLNESWLLS